MREVCKRGGFSDRNNIKNENTEIQLIEFDNRTRNAIFTLLSCINETICHDHNTSTDKYEQIFCHFVLSEIYAEKVDFSKRYVFEIIMGFVEETIEYAQYDSVLTIVEALVQFWNHDYNSLVKNKFGSLFDLFNGLFEKEYVGYRFVGDIIVPISDEIETKEIEETFSDPDNKVAEHIRKATVFLSDREKPDFENSIKESITAVETKCELITGLKGKDATLGAMLKNLEENGVKIHGALKEAFNKLYGYTSDANGIRHAGDIGGPNATFEEAKFMLVSCCAFINYLTLLQAKSK